MLVERLTLLRITGGTCQMSRSPLLNTDGSELRVVGRGVAMPGGVHLAGLDKRVYVYSGAISFAASSTCLGF